MSSTIYYYIVLLRLLHGIKIKVLKTLHHLSLCLTSRCREIHRRTIVLVVRVYMLALKAAGDGVRMEQTCLPVNKWTFYGLPDCCISKWYQFSRELTPTHTSEASHTEIDTAKGSGTKWTGWDILLYCCFYFVVWPEAAVTVAAGWFNLLKIIANVMCYKTKAMKINFL